MLTRPTSAARAYGPAILTVALVVYAAAYFRWPDLAGQVDLLVYRFGAGRVPAGQDLYSTGLTGNPHTLLFDYSPFAALCFLPLTLVTPLTVQILGLAANCGLVAYAVLRMLRGLGMTAATGLWGLGAMLVGLVAWLEPVRLSLQLGQVNLVILAVVVADLLGPERRRWAGVGIGLGRRHQADPGPVHRLSPADRPTARRAGGVVDVRRDRRGRVRGAAQRLGLLLVAAGLRRHRADLERPGGQHQPAWPVHPPALAGRRGDRRVAVALSLLALAVATLAWRRGHRVLAIAVVGMASDAASPFSWSHHWVWLAPLVVHLGHRAFVIGSRWSLAALCAAWVTFAGWLVSVTGGTPETGLLSIRPGGTWDVVAARGLPAGVRDDVGGHGVVAAQAGPGLRRHRHRHRRGVVPRHAHPVGRDQRAGYDRVEVDGLAGEHRHVVVGVLDGQDLVTVAVRGDLRPFEEGDLVGRRCAT